MAYIVKNVDVLDLKLEELRKKAPKKKAKGVVRIYNP